MSVRDRIIGLIPHGLAFFMSAVFLDSLLVLGVLPRFRHLQAGGALAGFLVMSGAVSFHLFTPLGVDPNNDGGGLFVAACINLAAAFLLLTIFRRREFGVLASRVLAIFAPLKPATVR